MILEIPNTMGQEQAKATMSEPSFAKISTGGQDSLRIQNRNLIEENNYLRNVNSLLRDGDRSGKAMFAEPGESRRVDTCEFRGGRCIPDWEDIFFDPRNWDLEKIPNAKCPNKHTCWRHQKP